MTNKMSNFVNGRKWYYWPWVCWHRYEEGGGFWFRIFGYGLNIRDLKQHPLMFSERNGYVWWFRVGSWMVKPMFGW